MLNNSYWWKSRLVSVQPQQKEKGFQVESKRWIVERTWTWLDNARILTRDYERLAENHEGMIYVVMIRLMLRRLSKNRRAWKLETP
ncbi:MAG: transposase [Tatlockia sp.]|nr:transposase [Tatlockia sp.]